MQRKKVLPFSRVFNVFFQQHLARQRLLLQGIAFCWFLTALCGCWGLSAIIFSLASAQAGSMDIIVHPANLNSNVTLTGVQIACNPTTLGSLQCLKFPTTAHCRAAAGDQSSSSQDPHGRDGFVSRPRSTTTATKKAPSKGPLRLQTPITIPLGRRLRVCSVARLSKDEKKRRSISAQHRYNRAALVAAGITDFDWYEISDEGYSGELAERPGILELREGIPQRAWDLIICEDTSRIYRNLLHCMMLVYSAVDKKIRVIGIGDDVDTAEEEWKERLKEAQDHHCRSNKYTRNRIKRAHDDLWELGAAVSHLHSGHRRLPTTPATDREPAKGPYFDEVDPIWAPYIVIAFERIAAGEPSWLVADWLTACGVPKVNGIIAPWSDREVNGLIRAVIYRGVELYGVTLYTHGNVSGEAIREWNAAEDVRERAMPHLRIVPDWLWYKANAAIDARILHGDAVRGDEHSLAGIPRDSRSACAKIFKCHCCKHVMHGDGRAEGGYRCAQIKRPKDHHKPCWNRATALRDITHADIAGKLIEALTTLGERVDQLQNQAFAILGDQGKREAERTALSAQEKDLLVKQSRLLEGLEGLGEDVEPPAAVMERLQAVEHDLAVARARLEGLANESARFVPPTRDELGQSLAHYVAQLEKMDRSVRGDLALLVGEIWAVPYQPLDSNKVVLRAKFSLRLSALLPFRTRAIIAELGLGAVETLFEQIPLEVNLFKPADCELHGLEALALQEQGLTLLAIGKKLGFSRMTAKRCVHYGKQLRAAGLTDPYIELTEPPVGASRWGKRKPKE